MEPNRTRHSVRGAVSLEYAIALIVIWSVMAGFGDVSWLLRRHASMIEANADLGRHISVWFNSTRGTAANCTELAESARQVITEWQNGSPRARGIRFECVIQSGMAGARLYPVLVVRARPEEPQSCLFCQLFRTRELLETQTVVIIEKDNTACRTPGEVVQCPV